MNGGSNGTLWLQIFISISGLTVISLLRLLLQLELLQIEFVSVTIVSVVLFSFGELMIHFGHCLVDFVDDVVVVDKLVVVVAAVAVAGVAVVADSEE